MGIQDGLVFAIAAKANMDFHKQKETVAAGLKKLEEAKGSGATPEQIMEMAYCFGYTSGTIDAIGYTAKKILED